MLAVAALGAATTGVLQPVVDWMKASDQTTSQLSALDERVKIVETNEVQRLKSAETDRAETARMANEIAKRIEAAARSGDDVEELQNRLREVQLRMERLSTQIEFLKERRR